MLNHHPCSNNCISAVLQAKVHTRRRCHDPKLHALALDWRHCSLVLILIYIAEEMKWEPDEIPEYGKDAVLVVG
jgi:hypothetical protein